MSEDNDGNWGFAIDSKVEEACGNCIFAIIHVMYTEV